MLVSEIGKLGEIYVEIGDTNLSEPVPPCGLSVPDQTANPGLMRDCMILLSLKDALRGTGALNWDTSVAIASWEGVTVAGTPKRVTKLKPENEGLTGPSRSGWPTLPR